MSTESNHIISDSDLIRECITGNRKMQELLYNRFSSKMYAVCLRYCSNSDDAQDLLQEGFVKVFNNLEKYRGDGSFEGWIRRIFVNTSIEYFRRKVTLTTVTETQETAIQDKDWNALESMAEKDIIKMIQQLSPGYRQVLNMYVIEGYSHKEISEILGISEGTSKSQLARAKVILKKMIETRTTTP
ncbi:RNA polymerase sigma factor [Ferruginibacter lapsinanis]|uniref:RNA polymerase sigma factor n=1 Tax=Ferruginibacter lapsinanis TaxID=563172 RepID=UPI001E440137|nr:RNA polymerase sigma factor [Ferruginibacter lapsinanis]UEG48524.1 RNA polymerase sigma factor [Ferruginibacter lapsinanis]